MQSALRRTTLIGLVITAGIAGRSLPALAVGPYAYVADTSIDKIQVLDAGAFPVRLVATIDVGDNPFGAAVPPGRNRVYVTNTTTPAQLGSVSVIDATNNSVIATVPTGVGSTPVGVAVNPAGTRVYVSLYTANQ